jgi:hypothetical protein
MPDGGLDRARPIPPGPYRRADDSHPIEARIDASAACVAAARGALAHRPRFRYQRR